MDEKVKVNSAGKAWDGCFTDEQWVNTNKALGVAIDACECYAILKEGTEWGWIERTWDGTKFRNRFTPEALKGFKDYKNWDKTVYTHTCKTLFLTLYSIKTVPKGGLVTFTRPKEITREERQNTYLQGMRKFSKGRPINIEVEDSTTTKPARILQNLAKGKNIGRPVLFNADCEETARKIVDILNKPFREYKNGKYEYYMKEPNEPFIPENEFTCPVERSDWRVEYWLGDDCVEYIEPTVVARTPHHAECPDAGTDAPAATKLDTMETYLKEHQGAHSLSSLRYAFGMERNMACAMLGKLINRGTVLKEDRGMYIHRNWVAYNNGGEGKCSTG